MPIIKSAKKRVKVATKAATRNAKTKRHLRQSLKAFAATLEGGKPAEITKAQNTAVSALDSAAKKAVIHKNKAARKKAQLAAQAKAKGVKPTQAAKKTPKTPAKKTAPKAVAKKSTAKKSAPKAKKTTK